MPNSRQAKKRMIQSEKSRQYNHSYISKMRTSIKSLLKSIDKKDVELVNLNFKIAVSIIDKSVNRNLIHKNKAARYKTKLNKKVKNLLTNTAN